AKDVATVPMNGVAGSLGVTGIMGHPATVESIRESALCLLVGTRLSMTARGGLEDALDGVRVLSVGSAEPYVPCTHVEATDLRTTLGFLARAVAGSVAPEHPVRRGRSELSPPVSRGPGVRYRDAMRALDESLPAGVDIVVDAGNTGAAALHYLPHRRDGRFLVALGMGGMGYSFGAGIGVACARGRRTVVIAGDGAFFMHGLELHTAVEHRLPVTFVVLNNNAHAMCVTREQLFYGDRYSYNRFHPSWIAAGLSAMFPGLFAVEVSDGEHLRPALATALRRPGPSVLSVACSADEIPPFAPFLAALESRSPVPSGQRTKEDHVHVRVSA
ncbi:MAG TPA: thiamine pyrophosphate-dependent enzyme, partial [Mycobacterium sp.]|nr:thiamine pyrophosphate-dependent enzyme [Mycobacterium sp.]